jgi:hypothetical protein
MHSDQTKTFPGKQYISISSREYSGNFTKGTEMSVSQYFRYLAESFKYVFFLEFQGLRDRRIPRAIETYYL